MKTNGITNIATTEVVITVVTFFAYYSSSNDLNYFGMLYGSVVKFFAM